MLSVYTTLLCNGSPNTCPTELKLSPSTTFWSCSCFLRCFSGLCPGACSGLFLFFLYTTPLSDAIEHHSIHPHSFADDTQLSKSALLHHVSELLYSPCRNASTMSNCGCPAINWQWMMIKQEHWLCPLRMTTSLPMPDSLTVGTSNVKLSQSVKTLGVTLDTHLN